MRVNIPSAMVRATNDEYFALNTEYIFWTYKLMCTFMLQ